jgi:hypothetical protein
VGKFFPVVSESGMNLIGCQPFNGASLGSNPRLAPWHRKPDARDGHAMLRYAEGVPH